MHCWADLLGKLLGTTGARSRQFAAKITISFQRLVVCFYYLTSANCLSKLLLGVFSTFRAQHLAIEQYWIVAQFELLVIGLHETKSSSSCYEGRRLVLVNWGSEAIDRETKYDQAIG